jgi:uncharacterized protein YbjQ (UPF0145 family)
MIVGFTLTIAGCAHLDYLGETAAPTTDVQVYYTEANVPRAYRVMGEVTATSGLFVSNRKIQEQMLEKARTKGADAIVLLGMEQYQSGETTSYTETTTEKKDKKGHTHTTTSGSSSSSTEENKKIHGLFIKFKTPAEAANTGGAPADSAH